MLSGKRVLVTGGSGFIGVNLIERLVRDGVEGINLDVKEAGGVRNILADLTKTDFSFLDKIEIDYAVHLAGFSSPARSVDEEETIRLNTNATANLFRKLHEKKTGKAVFFSSYVVYEPSETLLDENSEIAGEMGFYAKSKIMAEKQCIDLIERGFPLIIFRLGNSYGPRQQWKKEQKPTIIPRLIGEALINGEIKAYSGKSERDYIYVSDTVEGIIRALESSYNGVLNLGTGIGTSVEQIAQIIGRMTNSKISFGHDSVFRDDKMVLDIGKLEKTLKWKPGIRLEEGLAKTIEYYRKVMK